MDVEQYGYYELTLTTSASYDNPYVDVSLSAVLQSPDHEIIEIEGFWYGDNLWKIRMMPQVIGSYSYVTESNDPEMHGVSGEFTCIGSDRPGIVGLDPQNPYSFVYSNGEPYFWMGETAWYLMSIEFPFIDGTFQQYIQKRKSQHFNNIHCVLGTGGLPYKTYNPENEGGKIWVSQSEQRINPGFFEWMDKRIAYMDSLDMGLGLFFTWSQHFTTFSRDEYERYERYLIARYAAFPLIYWVIVGEFDETGDEEDYIYHGNVVNSRDPYNHLISIQPGHADRKNRGTNRIFADQDWLDFIMLQLPYHYSGSTYDAYDCNDYVLTDRIYDKPVLDIEFGYEDYNYPKTVVSSDDIRKFAWAIYMAGGYASYGHGDVIRTYDFAATDSPGSTYMSHLHAFFANIDWVSMEPDNQIVSSGFCMKRSNAEFVVYLPDGGDVDVNLGGINNEMQAIWFDPVDGIYAADGAFSPEGTATFTSPFADDAVLYLSPLVRPVLAINSDSLRFNVLEGSDETISASFLVTNAGEGNLHWSATDVPDVEWLTFRKSEGIAGEKVKISVRTADLSAGSYSCDLHISDPNAVNSPLIVPVVLQIIPGEPPVLAAGVDTLRFTAVESTDELIQRAFVIMNEGGGELFWTAADSPDVDWLTFQIDEGGAGDSVIVMLNTADLSPGPYTCELKISDPNAVNSPIKVPVILNIVASPPALFVDAGYLDFQSSSQNMDLTIANSGGDTLLWHVAIDSTIQWIETIFPVNGVLTANDSQLVRITVNRSGIPPGFHDAVLKIESNAGDANILLGMTVLKSAELGLNSDFLDFDSTYSSLSFQIRNDGDSTLYWSTEIVSDSSWIVHVDPPEAALDGGEAQVINVFAYRSGMSAGQYTDSLRVISNGGTQWIHASMDVGERYYYLHRVNCGSDSYFVDSDGKPWGSDKSYMSGYWGYDGGDKYAVSDEIGATEDDILYQTERWGSSGYAFDVENGVYDLSLYFAEIYFESTGMRVFDVIIEGDTLIQDLDIFAEAGHDIALIKTFQVTVTDSQLNIDFASVIEDPKISAIEIIGERWISGVASNPERTTPEWSRLEDNYPNPFNPSTVIPFSLSAEAFVDLCVFNTLGQKVTTLVHANLPKGEHRAIWEAHHSLPSGIYFYRIRVKGQGVNYTGSRKMLLTK